MRSKRKKKQWRLPVGLAFWFARRTLPADPGLYYCCRWFKVLYIGRSKSLRERWTDNFGYGAHHKEEALRRAKCTHIIYRVIRNPDRLAHEEAIAIHRHNPPLNSRRESRNRAIDFWDDVQQNVCLALLLAIAVWYVWPMLS